MDSQRLTDPVEVEAALHLDALVPPPAPSSIGSGATADLRASMARFSSGTEHATRRRAVELALAPLEEVDLQTRAEAATRPRLNPLSVDVLQHVAFVVPTLTLGDALGVEPGGLADLVDDVRSIVAVIGRGQPAGPASDDATDRLRRRFADHPGGADANISLLYQNCDATAALVASKVVARAHGVARRASLAKTVRHVSADVDVGAQRFPAGTSVELSLDDPSVEFGAGVHRCPGDRLAHDLSDGILAALSSWRLDVSTMQTDATGRATTLPMSRPS